MLLRFGSAFHQCAGEDLGSCDERAADAERRARQFFGRDATGHVLAFAAFAEAAVLGRDRQTECADFGETSDDFFRDVGIFPMHVLGVSADHFLSETSEGVLHHLVIAVQVARPCGDRERSQDLRRAVDVDECVELREFAHSHTPRLFAADEAGGEIMHHVGDECAGDRRFDASLCSVVEQRTSSLEGST